jgi:hypothetical protein
MKEKIRYPKICANPNCLKDFEAKYKEAMYCSRPCARVYGKTHLNKEYGVDYMPVTDAGYFDADAFCEYFYPKNKVERLLKPIGGEVSLRKPF